MIDPRGTAIIAVMTGWSVLSECPGRLAWHLLHSEFVKAIRQPLPPAKLVAGGWVNISPELMDSRVRPMASPRVVTLYSHHHITTPAKRKWTTTAH